jgi:predicted PurR-regulated permease PerM
MNPAFAPAATSPADPVHAVEQRGATADASLVSFPAAWMPVDARGLALGVLAALAALFALSWAQGFLVPLLLGIVLAYTLNPLVGWLEAIRIPRVAGTVVVIAGVIGGLCFGTNALRDQVQTIIEQVPEAATKFAAALRRERTSQIGTMEKMQNAATEVEKATTQAAGGSAAPRTPATHVIVDQPTFKLGTFLWASSMGALGAMGQAAMVVFLVFFLLLGGDTFKRKLVRLTGRRCRTRRSRSTSSTTSTIRSRSTC